MNHRLTDRQKIEIIDKYLTGKYTCAELGREYGAFGNNIASLLKRRGIKINNDQSQLQRKYTLNQNYFDKIDTEEKAYFLGLLYADGCNFSKENSIHISLQEGDKEILEKFNIAIESNKPLSRLQLSLKNSNWQNSNTISIHSKHMSQTLTNLGCVSNKSLRLIFPTEEQIPFNLFNHFLRGMWDGDGCICITNGKKSKTVKCFLSSTYSFCISAKSYLESLLKINFYTRNINLNPLSGELSVGGNVQCKKFLDWLYKDSTIYLERKYQKYKNCLILFDEINNRFSDN